MKNKQRHTFFDELTPLANKLAKIRDATPPRLSTAKDVPAIMAKQAAKLARRAHRAGYRPEFAPKDRVHEP